MLTNVVDIKTGLAEAGKRVKMGASFVNNQQEDTMRQCAWQDKSSKLNIDTWNQRKHRVYGVLLQIHGIKEKNTYVSTTDTDFRLVLKL